MTWKKTIFLYVLHEWCYWDWEDCVHAVVDKCIDGNKQIGPSASPASNKLCAHNKPHSWSNTTYVLQTSCMSSSKSLLIFTVETWEFWATRPTLRHWRWWCPPWSWTQPKFRSMERAQEKLIVVGIELDSTQDLALLCLLGEPGSRAMYDHI